MYLVGAQELRDSIAPRRATSQAVVLANLPTSALFDLLAVRLDADKVGSDSLKLEFVFPERGEQTFVTIANGVLVHRPIAAPEPVEATLTVDRASFLGAIFDRQSLAGKIDSGSAKITGSPAALVKLTSWIDKGAGAFPIVTGPAH